MLRMTATSTNHGDDDPMAAHATPPMKNAGAPSSVNARAAARQTDTYEISVLEARMIKPGGRRELGYRSSCDAILTAMMSVASR